MTFPHIFSTELRLEVLSVLSEISYSFVNIYKQLTQDRGTVISQDYFHLMTQE
jgi:hypothetical protein